MLLPSLAIALLLWLPFGFAMAGLIEEWDLLGLFTMHGTFFYTHLDGPLAAHALRPLMPLSFALAHMLSPDSFAGWHVLTILALVIKGMAMSWLGWRATGSRAAGVLAGALVLLYPADTMQLSFRSIHINVAGALALGAAVMAVRAFDAPRRGASLAWGLGAGLFFLGAGLMYELAFTLVAMPLAVLFVRHGLPRPWTRQRWLAAALWLGSVLVYAAYAMLIGRRISSYQGAVTGYGSALHYALSVWPDLFKVAAARALLGGWIDAARMTARTFQSYTYLAGASIVLVATCALALIPGRQRLETATPPAEADFPMAARLLVAGVVLMLMGYLPFMTSPAHIAISQRTYLWATPGAAFAWLAAVMLLARMARPIGAGAAVVLLVIGLGAQLFQFHHYVSLSDRQRGLLRAIVENFDGNSPEKKLLVLDGTSQIGHTWMFSEDELRFMLTYLFGRPMGSAEVCRLPSLEWERHDALGRAGRCSEDAQGWTFSYPPPAGSPGSVPASPPPSLHIESQKLLLAPIAADGRAILGHATDAHREWLRRGDDTVARRYRAILMDPPPPLIAPMFKDQFPSAHYRFDFGDWWSLEEVPWGSGWRESEWTGNGLKHISHAWKTSVDASLYVPLAPTPGPYVLRGLFDSFANGSVRAGMRIKVNGHGVALAWSGEGHFVALVPPGVLIQGRNELTFTSPVDPNFYGLSARIDWVALDPR